MSLLTLLRSCIITCPEGRGRVHGEKSASFYARIQARSPRALARRRIARLSMPWCFVIHHKYIATYIYACAIETREMFYASVHLNAAAREHKSIIPDEKPPLRVSTSQSVNINFWNKSESGVKNMSGVKNFREKTKKCELYTSSFYSFDAYCNAQVTCKLHAQAVKSCISLFLKSISLFETCIVPSLPSTDRSRCCSSRSLLLLFFLALNRHRYLVKLRGKLQSFTLVAVVKSRSFQSPSALHLSAVLFFPLSAYARCEVRTQSCESPTARRLPAGLISNHYPDTGRAINYCVLESAPYNLAELFLFFCSFRGERVKPRGDTRDALTVFTSICSSVNAISIKSSI